MKTSSTLQETNIMNPSPNHYLEVETLDSSNSFKLVSPKKGKLYKGPNYNAFNRETLGSIPGKYENILVKDNSVEKLGFSSNSQRFLNDNTISLSPGPGHYNINKTTHTSNKESISTKGYLNGFVSKSQRFDNLKEFYDKFYPGPGQYKNSETTSLFSEINKSMNYKNMFEEKKVISLKTKEDSPGPGDYNININRNKELRNNHFFIPKAEKFFKLKQDIFPGPKYEIGSGFSIPHRDKHTSHYFKKPIYDEKDKHKEDMLLGKEINDYDQTPGVGTYNLELGFGRRKKNNNAPYQIVKLNEYQVPKVDKSLNEINEHYYVKSSFDGKNSFDYVFKSHSPKIKEFEKNHNPGPAYYDSEKFGKLSFNYNINKNWI